MERKIKLNLIVLLLVLEGVLLQLQLIQADYELKVRAHAYRNSDSTVGRSRGCCDDLVWCTNPCDNQFIFCLRGLSTSNDGNPNNCPLGRYSTGGYIEGDSFTFSSTTFKGVPNPMTFSGNVWPGTVKLYIKVEDYDHLNSNDHVDDVYVTISLVPNSTFTPRYQYTGIYGNSRIDLSFRLQCSSDLYGNNCTMYCVARNDSEGHYSCGSNGEKICLSGWSEPSSNCTVSTCSSGCHLNGGHCNSSGKCLCSDGWNGTDCYQCVPGDDCYPLPCTEWQFPCQNETTCEIDNDIRGFFCRCAPGYQGENCSQPSVNTCNPDPCQNEGVCVNSIDDYTCTCQEGFTGRNCEIDLKMCRSDPCLNNGTCNNSSNTFECTCAPGFTGSICESMSVCATHPCFHGVCIDLQNDSFECVCPEGFEGRTCEMYINADIDDKGNVRGSISSATVGGGVAAAFIVLLLISALVVTVFVLYVKTRKIHKMATSIPPSVDNTSPNPAYDSIKCPQDDDNGTDVIYELISEHDAYVHMTSAMATECTVDDKIREDNVSSIDHESKNASPNTDSTPTGENAYAQIKPN